jgi:hypothetical protein
MSHTQAHLQTLLRSVDISPRPVQLYTIQCCQVGRVPAVDPRTVNTTLLKCFSEETASKAEGLA